MANRSILNRQEKAEHHPLYRQRDRRQKTTDRFGGQWSRFRGMILRAHHSEIGPDLFSDILVENGSD